MKTAVEAHFQGLWRRNQAPGAPAISTLTVKTWALERRLDISDVQECQVGLFRPIPAVALTANDTKACFPLISKNSHEWLANRSAADRIADLWARVEWFVPLWMSNQQMAKLLSAVGHQRGADAIREFDYHLSTVYTLPFQAVCIAQLLPRTRSLAPFAPLISGHKFRCQ
ncbi:TPA: hypothetical protein QEL09_002366 [Stenotrophomonas maltophilia]|nr:hypothetical protein [Stenotrophomonas maltophilia]